MTFPVSSSAIARWLAIWPGKRGVQNVARDSGCLLAHNLNHIRPRDETGTRKSLQNCTGAKEMIAVAMGGVDRRQILSARHNPIRQGARLLDRNRGVDQDGVALARNKR